MLQIAQLGTVLAYPENGYVQQYWPAYEDLLAASQAGQNIQVQQQGVLIDRDLSEEGFIPVLQRWANTQAEANEAMALMGRDLAAAVQLNVTVIEELASLFARNRSARSPFSSFPASSKADEAWGTDPSSNSASWYTRLLALMYGGDPLAIAPNGPWKHAMQPWNLVGMNSRYDSYFPGNQQNTWGGWPTLPYVRSATDGPEVWQLLSLARSFNKLELAWTNGVPDPNWVAYNMWYWVEAGLRADCVGCDPNPPEWPYDAESLLWKNYRVRAQHATDLAKLLIELYQNYNLRGSVISLGPDPANPQTSWIRLSKDSQFMPKRSGDLVQEFTYFSNLALTGVDEFNLVWDAGWQGFPMSSEWSEARRRVGAISALQTVRHMLVGASDSAPSANVQRFHENNAEILRTIDGAIGGFGMTTAPVPVNSGDQVERRVHITAPVDDPFWDTAPDVDAIKIFSLPGEVGNIAAEPGSTASPTDLFGVNIDTLLTSATIASITDPTVVTIGGSPRLKISVTLGDANGSYVPGNEWARRTLVAWRCPIAQCNSSDPEVHPEQIRSLGTYWLFDAPSTQQYDTQSYAAGGVFGDMLTKQMMPRLDRPSEPKYDGFGMPTDWVPPFSAELLGGEPGQSSVPFLMSLAKQNAQDATGAVKTAFETLLEAEGDETAQAIQTQRSRQVLHDIKAGLCGSDSADCATGIALSAVQVNQAWYPELNNWAPPSAEQCQALEDQLAQPTVDRTDKALAKGLIDCSIRKTISGFLSQQVQLAAPVRNALDAGAEGVPIFGEYSGGDVQLALIEQYRAIVAPREKFAVLIASGEAAKQSVETAAAALETATSEAKQVCMGVDLARDVVEGGQSAYAAVGQGMALGAAAGGVIGGPLGAGIGAAVGGIAAGLWSAFGTAKDHQRKLQACRTAMKNENTAVQAAVGASLDAHVAVLNAMEGTVNAAAAIAQSGAAIADLQNRAKLAVAREQLENKLATYSLKTSSGLYRRYHTYDLWRAKALVENARRFALSARRALEARYVVDLSDVTSPEAFVAAPATWSDQVYEYDLSLPKAVGLTVGTEQSDGVYSNKLEDYVRNLESYAAGYSVNRATATGNDDIDVVNLPGLALGTAVTNPPVNNNPGATYYPDQGNWTVLCPAIPGAVDEWRQEQWKAVTGEGGVRAACVDWTTHCADCCEVWAGSDEVGWRCIDGNPECATALGCEVAPIAARLTFSLDPWGRLNGDIANEAFEKRHNARWTHLAVNLVGTGVHDCEKAADVLRCYAQGFVQFDLADRGPAWLTDYDGAWHAMAVPNGSIEGGKALAAELWLDPLKDGWTTSYISPVARHELAMRPLAGDYEITIQAGPEVRLERIERVQLLVGSTYWVRQE